jgi:hypothetical protein
MHPEITGALSRTNFFESTASSLQLGRGWAPGPPGKFVLLAGKTAGLEPTKCNLISIYNSRKIDEGHPVPRGIVLSQ